ncbi:MAG TPA: family 16 glycoside hydrolase [Phycisphaerales bacterium]|nr:family 16 glycoside hydrolase [Phycisphaerales bacterium]
MHTMTTRRGLFAGAILVLAPFVSPTLGQQARAEREQGVTFRIYQLDPAATINHIPQLAENQTPNIDELRPSISFQDGGFAPVPSPFLTIVLAELDIPAPPPAGERTTSGDSSWAYRFRLTSDDGSRLRLDGRVIIDHDGKHAATPSESGAIELSPGRHSLQLEHFDAGGQKLLALEWQTPGSNRFVPIPHDRLWAEADAARVTSPGPKRIRSAVPQRPGDQCPVAGVHPSFELDTIEIEGFEPRVGAMCFHGDRLIIGTFDPLQRTGEALPDIDTKEPDKLYAIAGLTREGGRPVLSVCADGLYEPCGLVSVGDALYVSHRKAITKLTDTDGDGYFETHETVGDGWEGWNYHQFNFGLVHKDGKLYSALSTAMAPPKWEGMGTNAAPNGPMRGGIIETDLSSGLSHVIAGGCRTPNGLGLGPGGELFYCDNQGTWMPCNQLTHVVPGRFFGHYNNTKVVPQLAARYPAGGHASSLGDLPRTPATLLLPQSEVSNSPTQPTLIEHGPYKGQMLIGELTAGGLRRACLEKVRGQWQGAVFQFSQGFNCGINRVAWGPNGALYVGGIGAGGNWNWKDKRFGLQRLRSSGRTAFEMLSMHATAAGFEVRFTLPVDRAWLSNPRNFEVRQWTYAPTAEYGGPKIDDHALRVASATPNADGTAVTLTIPGLKQGYCVYLRTDPVSTGGEPIWSTEAWYTLSQIPAAESSIPATVLSQLGGVYGVGALPLADAATLIGRGPTANLTTVRTFEPGANLTQDDLLAAPEFIEMIPGHGDHTSRTSHADCRLHIEWYCPPGGTGQMAGNSGVYLQGLYELQVLGTLAGPNPPGLDEAAAIYNVKAADRNASTGPGIWQSYDIIFRAPRFEGGKKVRSARVMLVWNGVLVHDDVEVPGPTGSASAKGERPPPGGTGPQVGPLRLQEHASAAEGPVRYRNCWITPLEPLSTSAGEWQQPFNGTDLTGWSVHGGNAIFRVEDGEVVGTSAPNTPNTFLVFDRPLGDFELIMEVRQHAALNSGIQFRSHVEGGPANREGRLVGYQCELDPSDRGFTGGIYDESRRGWLVPLTHAPYARTAYRPGEWNRVRIVARGPLIQTWVNGVPAATMFDAVDASGHIALQVHDVGAKAEPMEVRWRNIRYRELGEKADR